MSDTPEVMRVDVPRVMRDIDYGWKIALIGGSLLTLLFTAFSFYHDQIALVKQVSDLKTEIQEMRNANEEHNRKVMETIARVDASTEALKQELQFYVQTQKGK